MKGAFRGFNKRRERFSPRGEERKKRKKLTLPSGGDIPRPTFPGNSWP